MSSDASPPPTDPIHVEDILEDLSELVEEVSSDAARKGIHETKELLLHAHGQGLITSRVRRLDLRDAAEALIGSVVFASPLLVEDGVFDIADHLFGYTTLGIPVFLVANTVFVVFMTYALLEWTGRDKLETHRLVGIIPARLIMILVIAFLVAAVLMIVWGRIGAWLSPTEAFARITVLWTVGALGAAIGDLISSGDRTAAPHGEWNEDHRPTAPAPAHDGDPTEVDLVADLNEQLADLEAAAAGTESSHEVQAIKTQAATALRRNRWFDTRIRKYTSRDVAEAFVGTVFFSIPLLVEDGVFDVADYFLSFRVGDFPVFFILNAAFVVMAVSMLVYWAGPQTVHVTRPLFGFIPRRLVGITVVSFLTVTALMTMYGRVGNWEDTTVAIARISAVWAVASFGAALGDILPGESSGADINDTLEDIGDHVEGLID